MSTVKELEKPAPVPVLEKEEQKKPNFYTNWNEQLKRKLTKPEEAVGIIKSDDSILCFGAASEPVTFLENLHFLKNKNVENVHLLTFLPQRKYEFYGHPDYDGVIKVDSMFFSRFCRDLQRQGKMSFCPSHLRNSGTDRFYYNELHDKSMNIYVITATPMDQHGYFNTSLTAMFNREMVKKADLVVVEINESLPRTFGDSYIHISEVDYIIQGESVLLSPPSRALSEEDRRIGKYIAELVEDGSTLQLGIGSIPNAVGIELRDKKNLGIHTEMLNDAIVELYKAGAVNNRKKTLHRDKMVTTFTYGSKETYEFIDNNLGVLHLGVAYVNDPYIIAQNKKMVSINTTLQVDLMGQCASEAIGTLQISGAGGQVDTAVGAKMSEGGKSIMALRSTAMVKNKDGERVRKSTIVPVHPAGTVITLGRHDADYVVTEYGIAALRGASLRERAEALIRIAHPDYKDELREEAERYSFL